MSFRSETLTVAGRRWDEEEESDGTGQGGLARRLSRNIRTPKPESPIGGTAGDWSSLGEQSELGRRDEVRVSGVDDFSGRLGAWTGDVMNALHTESGECSSVGGEVQGGLGKESYLVRMGRKLFPGLSPLPVSRPRGHKASPRKAGALSPPALTKRWMQEEARYGVSTLNP